MKPVHMVHLKRNESISILSFSLTHNGIDCYKIMERILQLSILAQIQVKRTLIIR